MRTYSQANVQTDGFNEATRLLPGPLLLCEGHLPSLFLRKLLNLLRREIREVILEVGSGNELGRVCAVIHGRG